MTRKSSPSRRGRAAPKSSGGRAERERRKNTILAGSIGAFVLVTAALLVGLALADGSRSGKGVDAVSAGPVAANTAGAPVAALPVAPETAAAAAPAAASRPRAVEAAPEAAVAAPDPAPAPAAAKKWAPAAPVAKATQHLEIAIGQAGYEPSRLTASAGRPVTLVVGRGEGCAAGFLMPSLGVDKDNSAGPVTVRLGALKAGTYPFSCAMGMVTGELVVE
jgi:plastocyanin